MNREPLFTNDQCDRFAVRRWVHHELERVAIAYWWGRYTAEDALQDVRGFARLIASRAKISVALIDAAVPLWLDDELSRQEGEHQASMDAMTEAALTALRDNRPRLAVRRAVAACAAGRPLLPPEHIMTAAVEAAALQHRRAENWWTRREAAE